ncbi:group I truncated hemoglobin [Brevibacillus sp. SYSU BS000544]|uniref:group I truncated hemoglobin n=1 Tax=Brevibacillus sp. SYSU BS000544 TaxID=3416443 RepID=UPI003CE4D473
MTTTIYEKVGGEQAIAQIVDTFYEKVLADDRVNHFFKDTDMDKQREHQAKFISHALGGPNQYSGQSMAKAHEGMNLQHEHFDAIVQHLTSALLQHKVSESDVREAIRRVQGLEQDIINK